MESYDSICCFRSREESNIKRVCWEITTVCNLRCPFCHRYNEQQKYYDIHNIEKTMSCFKQRDITSVILSGGEPLLHPAFFDILDILHRNRFELDVCTNGTIMDENIANRLSRYISEISVSIDGMTAERHDKMRKVRGCFKKTIDSVNLLIDHGFDVHVTTVVDADFSDQIIEMTDFLYSLSVKSIAFLGLIPIDAGENHLFSSQCQSTIENQVFQARKKYPDISINTKQLLVNKGNCSCKAGEIIWGMGTDGLKLCNCLLTRKRENKIPNNTGVGLCPGSKYLSQRIK